MNNHSHPLLFCGSSHPNLGQEIQKLLNISLGSMKLAHFPDGESSIEILEPVRGRTVFALQSIALQPNEYLMELLIIIDALKRNSAKHIIAIIPYFGYCRQDRKDKSGSPITAKLVANLLTAAGATRIITLDLHAGQLEGFFEIPVDHLQCQQLLAAATQKHLSKNCVVVAPDIGSIKIAQKLATPLNADLAVIEKERLSSHDIQMTLIGNVQGKEVVIADDICSTASTLVLAANLCHSHGAQKVIAAVTHGICAEDAIEKIEQSSLEALLITDTIPPLNRFTKSSKIFTLSVAPLISEEIKNLLNDYKVI